MRILLFGANGQVGWELARSLGVVGEVVAVDRKVVDLGNSHGIEHLIGDLSPSVVVNAAAYTNVDAAESDAAGAFAVNSGAVAAMAAATARANALLVHYSSDYVFDGSGDRAWTEDDPPHPINVYGRSKLAGEDAIRASGGSHLILRTSWVYASRGRNFVRTILRLAQERDEIRVVSDQYGAPTSARFIAQATAKLIDAVSKDKVLWARVASGEIVNLTNGGVTSWYGLARHVCDAFAANMGRPLARIVPVAAAEYKTAARRPSNSRLDLARLTATWSVVAQPWQQACDLVLSELVEQSRASRP